MAEFKSGNGKQHMMAAFLHLTKAMVESDYMTEDLKKILGDLNAHLSSMVVIAQTDGGGFSALEQRLRHAEASVAAWRTGAAEASKNFETVGEIHALMESLRASAASSAQDDDYECGNKPIPTELLRRAESLLHTAMSRLEDDLLCTLHRHKQYFEPEYMSFRSCVSDMAYDESFISVEEDSPEEAPTRMSTTGSEPDDCLVDLIQPHVIPCLKSIAGLMFASDYGQEFCQAFVKARKAALDEYWEILGMETFGIEEVLKMELKSLNLEIKRWSWIMKIIFRVYLPSEKRLCEQVLGGFGSVGPYCFTETSKAVTAYLLNFGEAVAMGKCQPEKMFRLLDMYEVLADLLLDIDSMLLEDARIEFHELLGKLGDFSRATFEEFKCCIASSTSTTPFPGGGVHPLTKYVMNYINTLAEYTDTLDVLLKDTQESEFGTESHPEGNVSSNPTHCPTAVHLLSIMSTLEIRLENRSQLYKDGALRHVFSMNNTHYIVQKVKSSKLGLLFGDAWTKEHMAKVLQHATGYERITWSSALALLGSNHGRALPKAVFKERCRSFSTAFEEVYRNQTAWYIKDPQLRDDLQISISQKVIHAYRNFTGRNSDDEKHIKYSAEDLQMFLLDLFEGSQKSLLNTRRK